ncbi:MAG: ribosome recycling factor [bacterium]
MNIDSFTQEFEKSIEYLKNDISGLRTGRASAVIVDGIHVEAYGVKQPIKSVGTINVPDSKTVTIEPWDKSLMANIEKAIKESSVGINPVNNGQQIILALPDLTSERRAELIKVLHQKLENAKISVRKIREEARDQIIKSEKNKEIGEDDKFRLQEELDKKVKDYNDKIKSIGDEKEKEINQI